MNGPRASTSDKYYDPADVDAYVSDVTATIRALQGRLQEALRRADEAERGRDDNHPETATYGRALLLAGEVAEKTISDADERAADTVRAAEVRATEIIESAEAEARRLLEAARVAAREAFRSGEARLLVAVGAFVDGSNVLRAELAKIAEDAGRWRRGAVLPTNEAVVEEEPAGGPEPAGAPPDSPGPSTSVLRAPPKPLSGSELDVLTQKGPTTGDSHVPDHPAAKTNTDVPADTSPDATNGKSPWAQ